VHIKIQKGLNIPISGKPEGEIRELAGSGSVVKPAEISLNLSSFDDLRLRLLKKVDERVKIGEPLCEDKGCPGRMFVSPATGSIKEIRRGVKRRLIDIVIQPDASEEIPEYLPVNPEGVTRHDLISLLLNRGLFTTIQRRPFCILPDPKIAPRSIFVKAVESAPFTPPAELQVEGLEAEFQAGLTALSKLTDGPVHLVYRVDSPCKAFTEAKHVQKHTVEGPHPIGTHSLHIQHIDPIKSSSDVIWTLNAHDVVRIGYMLTKGKPYLERVIAIAGPGIIEGKSGYFRVRDGYPVASLTAGRVPKSSQRYISGDPLTGKQIGIDGFLGYNDYVFSVIPENTEREFLHFFRPGFDKYSFSRAYMSGHRKNPADYPFTTNQHGEHRAFIDATLYDKVMPMNIPVMHLVKSVLAENFELAEELGLLEVAPEDFALSTFVCPSKMEMTEIMKQGIRTYAGEMLG